MSLSPLRIYRQNTMADLWPCVGCGHPVQSHVFGLLRNVCVTCTPAYVASLPSVWIVEDAALLRNRQQLVNGNVVHGSHVSHDPPEEGATCLGPYHSDVIIPESASPGQQLPASCSQAPLTAAVLAGAAPRRFEGTEYTR